MNAARPALRPALTAIACLALAACGEREPAPEPEVEETVAEPDAEATDPTDRASIIRPDIEIARTVDVEPLEMTLGFGTSGTQLSAEAVTALAELIESPQVTEFEGTITLRGHSDAGGNDQVNMRLSRERAEAAAQWLIENGIDEERIEIIAFGEQNPVAPNALPDGTPDEEGRATNRRVEITVAVPEGANIPAPAEPTPEPAEESAVDSVTRQLSGD
ncbi:OmpA family protein [Altererythrobacter sp. MTPC7]|uniref:OmpA family protein n=1 Tax=Altererythrobacter sp. MTPC7 TaxID=3056567 RepID=UPI0036F33408